MLELIFQGFVEWLYSLILEAWEYFGSAMLNVMSLDFAYLKSHIPVIPDIQQILLATGWALLIGNLVFQSTKSMLTGLGFEGEDPKLLFTRTFVFSFLLLASPQICDIGLSLTSTIMELLQVPNAVNVHLVDDSAFGSITVSWLLIIIFDLIIMFQVFKLLLEIAERYVILAALTITAPLAFGVGGSRSTSDIFTGWCRMYGSMCLLMVTHVIFFKMLLSVLSAVPSGLDTLLWMVLILSIVKVAKKTDNIITRIGLNPAFTGDSLRVVPGALSYVVLRQAASQVTKSLGKDTGSSGRGRSAGSGPRGWGPRSGGPRGTGGPGGVSYTYNNPSTASESTTSPTTSVSTATSKAASSAALAVNSTTAAPLIAPTGGSPALSGSKPPNVPPDSGPISPDAPTLGSPISQTQQNHFQPQIGQSGVHQITGSKKGAKPPTPAMPPMPGGIIPNPPVATPPSSTQSGSPDFLGKAGIADPSAPHHPIAPSKRVPSDQAVKLSTQATQHIGINTPLKPADRQPGAVLPSNPVLKEKPDPGSAVTIQEHRSEARFSHREAHTPGRASSLTIQGVQSTEEHTSEGASGAKSQASRFTARPGIPGSDSTRRERISTSEIKSARQSNHAGSVPGTAKVAPPSAVHPTPSGHTTEATTVSRPGTAGKPPSPAATSSSPLPRQGRNVSPKSVEPSATPAGSSPVPQERRLSDPSPVASVGLTPRLGHGTAGMDAPTTTPSPDRTPRQSRKETSVPTKASTPVASSSPVRQEGSSPVSTSPRPAAPSQRLSPGTAGMAPSPMQMASPAKPVSPPTRPARPTEHTPPSSPAVVKPVSPAAKAVPAIKATPAPADTRLKRGYPAKPTKGGKKRHGR